jgi:hypothetical protein
MVGRVMVMMGLSPTLNSLTLDMDNDNHRLDSCAKPPPRAFESTFCCQRLGTKNGSGDDSGTRSARSGSGGGPWHTTVPMKRHHATKAAQQAHPQQLDTFKDFRGWSIVRVGA